MSEDMIRSLEGRIVELENELKQMRSSRQQAADITPEEMQVYMKVRGTLAWDPEGVCGINECSRCIVHLCYSCINLCWICRVCDVECICGPCNLGGIGRGGLSRFGGLGG